MEIKPTYVTWEQAKLLKEKGFKYYCPVSYWEQELTYNTPGYALENGETSQENYYNFERYYAPEQWEVIEWLRVKYGIWISINTNSSVNSFGYYITTKEHNHYIDCDYAGYSSPQEAYSAAIDYVLENLI